MNLESSTISARITNRSAFLFLRWEGAGETDGVQTIRLKANEKATLELPCAAKESLPFGLQSGGIGLVFGVRDAEYLTDHIHEQSEWSVGRLENQDMFGSATRLHS